MVKKVLVFDNEQKSDSFINANKKKGVNNARELLNLYRSNELPEITSTSELKKFLEAPGTYYENKVMAHVKERFPGESFNFKATQQLFNFTLEGWKKLHTEHVVNFLPYLWLDSNGLIILARGWEKKLRESFKVYTTDPEEIEILKRFRELGKLVIELYELAKPQTHLKPVNILGKFGLHPDGYNLNPKMLEIAKKNYLEKSSTKIEN